MIVDIDADSLIESTGIVEILKHDARFIVEVLGSWVWVTGPKELFTEKVRTMMKDVGFRFSGKKKSWYKKPDGTKTHGRGFYKDMNELRNHWEVINE